MTEDKEDVQQSKEIPAWRRVLQKPSDVVEDIYIPNGIVNKELYAQGYWHGRNSTKLTDFHYSFRMGFRQAMLERAQDNQFKASKFHVTSNYD